MRKLPSQRAVDKVARAIDLIAVDGEAGRDVPF
jgi:hypothetical protein